MGSVYTQLYQYEIAQCYKLAFHKVQKQNCENDIIFSINSTSLMFAKTEMLKLLKIKIIAANKTI